MRGRIHPSSLLPQTAVGHLVTTRELLHDGLTKQSIRAAVSAGALIRVRRGQYLPEGSHPIVVSAAKHGGRVDCVSLLALMGVFVLTAPDLHIHVPVGASRLPRPQPGVIRHWRPSRASGAHTLADPIEAIAQAVRCQTPRAAIATLDSALHLGLVDELGLAAVFALLPRRFQALRPLIDERAESGTETLVRLILRAIGCQVVVQVTIDGVGRVDFLVDGWLIVECDSRAHHSDWATLRRDRRRDAEAAAQGYTTVRLLAEDVFGASDDVGALLRRIVRSRPCRPELLIRAARRPATGRWAHRTA